jgi:hypothetical protein
MRRSLGVLALVAVSVTQVFAVFGNPSFIDSTYNSVGLMEGSVSCVAIDPHWILTARHVDGSNFVIHGNSYTAVAGQDFADPNSDLRVIRVNETIPVGDIALLGFGNWTGQTATLVGYGGTGSGITGNAYNVGGGDGLRHRAVNVLDGTELIQFDAGQTPWQAYFYDLDDPAGTGNGYIAGEGGVWFGDSGGGWFVDTVNGPRLVAISSAIFNPAFPNGGHENEFGSLGYGTDLTSNSAFIAEHVPGAVPEPASMAVLGLGALALLRRRKK